MAPTTHDNLRSWLPSISQWLWLIVFLTLLGNPWRTRMVSADGDACFHWQTGEQMLQGGQLIGGDPFSHTRAGQPIPPKEWLSQVLFALAGRRDGLSGVSLLGALLIATTIALLHRQLIREGSDPLTATLVTLVAMWTSTTHWLARPHLFSFVMVVLWHGLLRRGLATQRLKPLALGLPLLTLFWVNLHGAYLTGFIMLGAYWLGALLTRNLQQLKHLTFAGLLCGLASLFNPSGFRVHQHNLEFLRGEFLPHWLAEYASLDFQSPESWGFLAWLAVLFAVLVLVRPATTVGERILLLVFGYFALYAIRNAPLLALVTAPLIAAPLSRFARERWAGWRDRELPATGSWRSASAVVVAAGLIVGCQRFPITMPADRYPVEAVAYIRQHPAAFAGPMFNQYLWGGYLIAFLPEHKVFIDGRADFYGEELVREFDRTTDLRPDWPDALERYHVAWTLMPTEHPLNVALALAGWEEVYRDATATIYRRPTT